MPGAGKPSGSLLSPGFGASRNIGASRNNGDKSSVKTSRTRGALCQGRRHDQHIHGIVIVDFVATPRPIQLTITAQPA